MAEKKVDTVVRVSPLQVQAAVKMHYRTENKKSLNFIGEPSTVKSVGVQCAAQELAREREREFFDWNRRSEVDKRDALEHPEKYFILVDYRASETDIGELRLQDMKTSDGYITYKYGLVFVVMSNPKAEGILFFDEMNLAPNMIKAQFYKVINDHCVGDIPISKGVLCVSAGNEAEHARGVSDDPVPLVLRRANYFLRPLTSEEYADFSVASGQHQWITAYLSFAPHNTHKIKYDVPGSISQPCPRSWTNLSDVLQANPNATMEQIAMLANAYVGPGVGSEFISFVKMSQKVNLDEIIKHPEKIAEFDPNNNDQLSTLWAIVIGVVERARADKKVMEPGVMASMSIKKTEIGVFMMRQLKVVNEKALREFAASKPDVFKQVVAKYGRFLLK